MFETEDGGVLRHHAEEHFDALLAGFEPVERQAIAIRTMNGNPATAVQILARLRRRGRGARQRLALAARANAL